MATQTFPPDDIVYRGKVYVPFSLKFGVPTGTTGTVIAGQTGKKIVVLGYVMQVDAGTSAKWKESVGGTDLSGAMKGGAGGLVIPCPVSRVPWFVLPEGADLQLEVAGGTGTSAAGHVLYAMVDA